MASIRDLKKDINFVLGDIIEEVYVWEAATGNHGSEEGSILIDKTIAVFDGLMSQIHQKEVENQKAHFAGIRKELADKAEELVADINQLA